MPEFLLAAAGIALATVGLGLIRLLRGPGDEDRMMAAQLVGSGGVATLLLLGAATDAPGAVDLALTLAVLTAFASVAFTTGTRRHRDGGRGE